MQQIFYSGCDFVLCMILRLKVKIIVHIMYYDWCILFRLIKAITVHIMYHMCPTIFITQDACTYLTRVIHNLSLHWFGAHWSNRSLKQLQAWHDG